MAVSARRPKLPADFGQRRSGDDDAIQFSHPQTQITGVHQMPDTVRLEAHEDCTNGINSYRIRPRKYDVHLNRVCAPGPIALTPQDGIQHNQVRLAAIVHMRDRFMDAVLISVQTVAPGHARAVSSDGRNSEDVLQ